MIELERSRLQACYRHRVGSWPFLRWYTVGCLVWVVAHLEAVRLGVAKCLVPARLA